MERLTEDQRKDLHGNRYARRFEARQAASGRLDRLVAWVEIPPAAVVADFGCGSALLLDVLPPWVAEYHGVDFSEAFIRAARAKSRNRATPRIELVCKSIQEFCLERSSFFDVGFAFDLSEHVYDAEWVEILRSILSALRPSARLYLHTPNAEFIVESMKARNLILKQFPEHVAVRSRRANEELLERAGFEIRRTLFLPHYNVLRHLHLLSSLPGVGRFFRARLLIEAKRPA